MNTDKITALLERVEGATEPDRMIDVDLAILLTDWRVDHDEYWNWHEGPIFSPAGDAWCIRVDGRKDVACNEALPRFTFSVDAALALVERMPGAYSLKLTIDPSGNGADLCWWPNGLSGEANLPVEGCNVTLPLAIIAAILKALKDQSGGRDG